MPKILSVHWVICLVGDLNGGVRAGTTSLVENPRRFITAPGTHANYIVFSLWPPLCLV